MTALAIVVAVLTIVCGSVVCLAQGTLLQLRALSV